MDEEQKFRYRMSIGVLLIICIVISILLSRKIAIDRNNVYYRDAGENSEIRAGVILKSKLKGPNAMNWNTYVIKDSETGELKEIDQFDIFRGDD